MPPATNTFPFASSVAVCERRGLTRLVVGDQIVPSHRSAVAIEDVPLDVPPATSTCPLPSTAVERSVAVWAVRPADMFPADGNVGVDPLAGIVNTNVSSSGDPVLVFPPVISTLPFASFVAV